MDRRTETDVHIALWIERLVWHFAAGAALAVMILVLLGSLRWLDEVAPRPVPGRGVIAPAPVGAGGDLAPPPPPAVAIPPPG